MSHQEPPPKPTHILYRNADGSYVYRPAWRQMAPLGRGLRIVVGHLIGEVEMTRSTDPKFTLNGARYDWIVRAGSDETSAILSGVTDTMGHACYLAEQALKKIITETVADLCLVNEWSRLLP